MCHLPDKGSPKAPEGPLHTYIQLAHLLMSIATSVHSFGNIMKILEHTNLRQYYLYTVCGIYLSPAFLAGDNVFHLHLFVRLLVCLSVYLFVCPSVTNISQEPVDIF